MGKKSSMQKEVEKTEGPKIEIGEQIPLIDVGPKNSKEIAQCARRYKEAQSRRLIYLDEEKDEKQKIIELVRKSKLKPLTDGTTKFRCDGMIITIEPRDELVKIKEEKED